MLYVNRLFRFRSLFYLVGFFLLILSVSFLFENRTLFAKGRSLSLSASETKAIRREMVDMDIQLRSLASHIALGYSASARRSAMALSNWQTRNHPELKNAWKKIVKKFRKDGALKYGLAVQKHSKKIISRIRRGSWQPWNAIENDFKKIAQSCRGCHKFYKLK